MNQIPESIIEDIRARADIVEIVSKHVQLKKSGQSWKGLCPFHTEKTPSFTVNPARGIFHCFGCNAGGNVFRFLMQIGNVSFVEAVRGLARDYGVEIPETRSRASGAGLQPGERELLSQIVKAAAEHFAANLRDEEKGRRAREYLQARAIDAAAAARLQLGWALPAWRDLLTYFERLGRFTRADIEKAGLIRRKAEAAAENANYYDHFRGRLMFPLHDANGNITGFAGRIIDDSEEAKYVNSPETALYKKSQQLFGLHTAREWIRKESRVLIVEGYFDQIRVAQAGVRNVVATCGTALTPRHAQMLKHYAGRALLVFDGDAAGQAATQRAFELFAAHDMRVDVLELPPRHDPDSFILKEGGEAFTRRVAEARSFIEHFIEKTARAAATDSLNGKMEAVNRVLPVLAKCKSGVERAEGAKILAERLQIEEKRLRQEMQRIAGTGRERMEPAPFAPAAAGFSAAPHLEEFYLLQLLFAGESLAGKIRQEVPLAAYRHAPHRAAAEFLYRWLDAGKDLTLDRVLDQVEDAGIRMLLTRIGAEPEMFEDNGKACADCIRKIKVRELEEKIKELKKERREAEKAGDAGRSRQLQQQVEIMRTSLRQAGEVCGV